MNDEQMEELRRTCIIVGENITRAAAAVVDAMAIVAANISDIMDDLAEQYEVGSTSELLEAFERIKAMADMDEIADDLDAIIPAEKLPRPPKRLGPVNKANYTSNRPKRQARSHLHKKAR